MVWTLDARIPVIVTADPAALPALLRAGKPAALLAEAAAPQHGPLAGAVAAEGFALDVAAHAAACACCAGRTPAAAALDRLFLARVRGGAWFDRVIACLPTDAGRAAVADALRTDPLAKARFRAG